LIDCAAISDPVRRIRTSWFGWAAKRRLRKLLKASRAPFYTAFERMLLLEPWQSSSTKSELIRAIRAFEVSWPGPFERQLWREELKTLKIPTLLLWGGRDLMNEPDAGLRLVRELPEAYFFQNDDSGHWPNLDAPDWVSEKILQFAFRLSGPSSVFPAHEKKIAG
jgi:pimeloyl-ACP methyl ester carboxylesterase